jgi:hypothetical protein
MPVDRSSREPKRPHSEAPESVLPAAERRRRLREFWITVVVLAVIAALLLLQPLSGLTQGVADSGLFLFLNAVTVILILLLGFLVTRNFWKLIGERRLGILGSHLNLKFVTAMFLIAFVTTSGLFLVSAFFITQSIDKWFSVQVDRALASRTPTARSITAAASQRASPPGGYCGRRCWRTWASSCRSGSARTTWAWSRSSAPLARSWSAPSIPRYPRPTFHVTTAISYATPSPGGAAGGSKRWVAAT